MVLTPDSVALDMSFSFINIFLYELDLPFNKNKG